MVDKNFVKEKLKKEGKALYEQGIRVTKTLARNVENNIVGLGRKEELFEQVAQMQAHLYVLMEGEGFTEGQIESRVNEILGIPKVEIKKPTKASNKKK